MRRHNVGKTIIILKWTASPEVAGLPNAHFIENSNYEGQNEDVES